jgi:hypothetical protein
MATKKKKKKILPEFSFRLNEKPHKVSTIDFHYGSQDASEKDRVFKMSFSVEVEGVPKAIRRTKYTYDFSACLEVLREQGNAPMANYITKVIDSLGDEEMKEIEAFKVLVAEGFQLDKFIEGVIFSVVITFENIPLEPDEEDVDWEVESPPS